MAEGKKMSVAAGFFSQQPTGAGSISDPPPFSFQQVNPNVKQVVELSLDELFPFKDHVFKVRNDNEMAELVNSVSEYGVRQPVQVRPRSEGGYEILAGHRRIEASRQAEKRSVPAIIENVDDDIATIIMVDTNLGQRQNLLPSEKAFAYKARLEAMKRQTGRPSKEMVANVATISQTGKSRDILAEGLTESARTIQNYIRLTELIPALLNVVDSDKLKLVPAVIISYLNHTEQKDLWDYIKRQEEYPSKDQATALRQASEKGDWNLTVLSMCMESTKQDSGKATIKMEELDPYFQQKTPKAAQAEVVRYANAVAKVRQFTTIFPESLSPEDFERRLLNLVETVSKQRMERKIPTR